MAKRTGNKKQSRIFGYFFGPSLLVTAFFIIWLYISLVM